jgi:hypothetical protein
MAFTGSFMATSFKGEILQGYHQFTAPTLASRGSLTAPNNDTFRLALYTNSASFTAATQTYTSTNEVSNSGSYTAGGGQLTGTTLSSSGTTAFLDFSDLSFTSATITARGAMIYNDTQGDRTVAILDFGADKTSTAGTFTIQFPTPDATNAIIRIA